MTKLLDGRLSALVIGLFMVCLCSGFVPFQPRISSRNTNGILTTTIQTTSSSTTITKNAASGQIRQNGIPWSLFAKKKKNKKKTTTSGGSTAAAIQTPVSEDADDETELTSENPGETEESVGDESLPEPVITESSPGPPPVEPAVEEPLPEPVMTETVPAVAPTAAVDLAIAVSPENVKALRDATGAGRMECKNALLEAEGDLEAAKKLLQQNSEATKDVAEADEDARLEAAKEQEEARIVADLEAKKRAEEGDEARIMADQEAKLAEEKRLAEEKERAKLEAEEAAKAAEEKRVAEEEEKLRLEAEAKAAEEKRVAEEEEKLRLEAEAKAAEEKRIAEEEEKARLEAEAKAAEEKRIAEEEEKARLEAEAKAAEEKRIAEEEEKARLEAEAKAAQEKRIAEEKEAAAARIMEELEPRDDPVTLTFLNVKDVVAGRTTPSDVPSRPAATIGMSAGASAPGGGSGSNPLDNSLQQMLEDARQMQSEKGDSGKSLIGFGDDEGDGGNLKQNIRNVISTIVTADFFVVCGFLLWFLAGIFSSYVLKDDTIQIAFNSNFEAFVQPALGILMIGAIASNFFGDDEDKEEG